MSDMLVRLYDLPEKEKIKDISIFRALSPDKKRILKWIEDNSSIYAAGEADVAFSNNPISLFIAIHLKKIVGYACYDATNINFFGPTRVLEEYRGRGIGKALLLHSLHSMRDAGYAYAIIGGIGPKEFYEKSVDAILIEKSTPGIYKNFLKDE